MPCIVSVMSYQMKKNKVKPTFRRKPVEPAPEKSSPGVPVVMESTKEVLDTADKSTTYKLKYDPNWRVTKHYNPFEAVPMVMELGCEGASITEMTVALGIIPATMRAWRKDHPEFDEAMEHALLISQAWWERVGRLSIFNDRFNSSLFMMHMSNRFGWSRNVNGKFESETKETKRLEVSVEVSDDPDRKRQVLRILRDTGALGRLLGDKSETVDIAESNPKK